MKYFLLTSLKSSIPETSIEIWPTIDCLNHSFGIETEITARISKMNVRIYEVGISYYGRTYADGKKIGWRDGFRAIYCIVKYNLR